MKASNQRRQFILFLLIAGVLLLQVGWWAASFLQNVGQIEQLQIEMGTLPASQISSEAFHRNTMFLSESFFFLLLMAWGLVLLHRALKFEKRARETQKNFIDTLAHELKTPLTTLKLRLGSVLENQKDGELSQQLGAALGDIRCISAIVEKTLDLNRMEREELVKELVNVGELLRELCRRMEPLFRSHGVYVDLDLRSDACVLADVDGLRNSLQSVIENSVLYNDKAQKQVILSISEKAGKVSIKVSDNGPGIPEADGEKIFEKFYRGRSRSKVPGTGLGLFIARSIVNAHHGAIRSLSSVSGAVFEIELPVVS